MLRHSSSRANKALVADNDNFAPVLPPCEIDQMYMSSFTMVYWSHYVKTMLSTKLEIRNRWHYHQRRTEPQQQINTYRKFHETWTRFLRCAKQTDSREIDRDTHRHADCSTSQFAPTVGLN